ncbi:hypothetical protein ACHQM5_024047 [Ranunculus cassubicifolius]
MLLSRRISPLTNQTLISSFSPHPHSLSNLPPKTTSFSIKSFHQTLISPLLGYINGANKSSQFAHSVWQKLIQKGDTLIDATCGNGHDTLALTKMVSTQGGGWVYAIDIQKSAIDNTTSLLNSNEEEIPKENVKLFQICHSRMEEIVPKESVVRVVAFNLGYLPGGDKSIITVPERTLEALKAASRLVESGGVISVLVYVGHSGGREEYETVMGFAAGLPVENWVCSKFEMVNRPLAPVNLFIYKR